MAQDDRRRRTNVGVATGIGRRRTRALGTAVAAAIAALAAWPAAAPAAHPPYPDAPLGTAQSGTTLLTSEPFCGADYGRDGERPSHLATHGGDMAFWKSRAVLACGGDDDDIANDGFVILDIADPAHPVKLGEFRCVASASDIAIWGDLVFLAVDRNSEAGLYTQPGPRGHSCIEIDDPRTPTTFAGVRIVSIADPAAPVMVKSVEANIAQGAPRGAHNVTVVPDLRHRAEDGTEQSRVLVYAAFPGLGTQDVISVPLAAPGEAAIAGSIAAPGLKSASGQFYPDAVGCHDISFFLPRGLATCHAITSFPEGISGTIIWDVRDDPGDDADDGAGPLSPTVVSQITSATDGFPGRRDHSSAFSWDGNTLVITDENLYGLATRTCDSARSVLWFYDVRNPEEPVFRGTQIAHPVADNEWCPSKQLSVVPLLNGDDVLVVSWFGGGTTVVDFTDPAAPREIGVFADFVPSVLSSDDDASFAWASYWYAGHVFVNNAWGCARPDICFGSKLRGLDVLTLHGITASQTARLQRFNFGTQECLTPLHKQTSCR